MLLRCQHIWRPRCVEEAILDATTSEHPPFRLLLVKPELDLVYKKLDAVRQDLDTWRETTLGADFLEYER